MLDPLVVEQDFQNLSHSLRILSSNRSRILLIVKFLEPIVCSANPTFLAAYRRELIPQLRDLLEVTDLSFTSPAFLQRAKLVLDAAQSTLHEHGAEGRHTRTQERIRLVEEKVIEWARSRSQGEYLFRAENRSSADQSSNTCWVPLVEREPVLTEYSGHFALLRQLHVEVLCANGVHLEDVIFLNRGTDLGGLDLEYLREAIVAAKALFHEVTGILPKRPLRVYCGVNDPHLIGGASLGPSIAMLVFVELLKIHNLRGRFSIPSRAVVTGRIAVHGRVLPIDESGLAQKLEACMYSWVHLIAVPKEQEDLSREIVRKLAAESGIPPIAVVGIDHLRELLSNRRLTTAWNVPVVVHVLRQIWKTRRPLAAAILVCLSLLVAWQIFTPMDLDPVDAIYTSTELVVRNRFGKAIERIPVATSVPIDAENYYMRSRASVFALCDIEGDGRKEVIWSDVTTGTQKSLTELFCKTIGEDSLRWNHSLRKSLRFVRNKDIHSDKFGAVAMLVEDLDRDGTLDVIVVANHEMFFPSLLVKVDASSGREISHYVHIGHLNGVLAADTDEDGLKEVISYGTNNAFNMAAIAIFEPEGISGHSPLTPEYALESSPLGTERQYLLIPKTTVGEAFSREVPRNGVTRIDRLGSDGLLRANILEVDRSAGEPDQILVYGFAYFGSDFAFKGYSGSDGYDVVADRLLAQGKILRKPDKPYFEEWGKTIRYWNGDSWQPGPVLNRLGFR